MLFNPLCSPCLLGLLTALKEEYFPRPFYLESLDSIKSKFYWVHLKLFHLLLHFTEGFRDTIKTNTNSPDSHSTFNICLDPSNHTDLQPVNQLTLRSNSTQQLYVILARKAGMGCQSSSTTASDCIVKENRFCSLL